MTITPQKKSIETEKVFRNQTVWTGDNLHIMRGLPDKCVDLIYLDPPFNSNRSYSAPIGSQAAGAAFKDTWTLSDCDNAWHGEIAEREPAMYQIIATSELSCNKSMKSYLIMMAVRLIEMKRILKDSGSVYLHCDPTASHYLKLLLDTIFGYKQFRNEVIWCYKENDTATRYFPKKHDVIFWYSKTKNYTFNIQRGEITEAQRKRYNHIIDGEYYANMKGKMRKLQGGAKLRDWWDMPIAQKPERTDYPTQKPLALLERIIKASSNEGDLVLDPFCGCATALIAAERLNRQWIGIDLSEQAVKLVTSRMKKEDNDLFKNFSPICRTDIPKGHDTTRYNIPENKKELYGKQEGICNGCQVLFPYRNMTIDHIVPQNDGGSDNIENLQLLCGACNSTKGKGTHEELIVKLRQNGFISNLKSTQRHKNSI